MPQCKKYRALAWVLSLSVAGFAGTALAQTDEAADVDEENVIEEVIVTAERMQRTELDTASSITSISAAIIESRSLESIADIINQVPNVTTGIDGGNFRIRGISNSTVTGGGDGGLATIYLDGAPLSQFATSFGPRDTWDLQSVEIFRGAQSTNLGRDSLAGAIVMRTADPVYKSEYKARIRVMEYGGLVLSAVANMPLSEDTAALRFAIDKKQTDGFISNTTLDTDKHQAADTFVARGKLLFEPNENFRNIVTLTYSKNEFGDSRIVGPDYFDRISTANILPENNLKQTIATWEADYQFDGPWQLSNVLSYNKADYTQISDDDGTAAGGINSRTRDSKIDTLTEELRLFYQSDRLTSAFGFYYAKEDEDNFRTIATGLDVGAIVGSALIGSFYDNPFLLSSVDLNGDVTTNYAAYVNVDYDVSSFFTLNLALRYDHESKDFNGGRTVSLDSPLPDPASVPPPLAPTIGFVNGLFIAAESENPERVDTSYDAWLPQLGGVFHISDEFTAVLQAKRAYRAGGGGTSLILGDYNYDPEYAWTYEAGLRKSFLGGLGMFKTNIYHIDWKDMQVIQEVPAGGGDFFVSNAASSRLDGIEVEISVDPTEQWSVFANLGYSKTKFTDFINQAGDDLSGNEFPGASKWTASTGVSWFGDRGFFAQADINYQSDAPTNVTNTTYSDARTLVNGKIGYAWSNMEVNVFGRNMFDAEYVSNTTGSLVIVGHPRVFGVEFRIWN